MHKLFELLKRFQYGIVFLLLEAFCIVAIIQNNPLPSTWYFAVSGNWRGWTQQQASNINSYLGLRAVNNSLAEQNAKLLSESEQAYIRMDSARLAAMPTPQNIDKKLYEFIPAKVLGNSLYHKGNTMLLSKGSNEGIRKDMGVIGPDGIVGIVVGVSENFSVVLSLLNKASLISAKILPGNYVGTVSWEGDNAQTVSMRDLPTHVGINKGDTVITSGFSLMFPEGIPIGTVKEYGLDHDKSYYKADLNLSTDFASLQWVYIIHNIYADEQNELLRQAQSIDPTSGR